ncbi:MAG: hypothetical protein ACREPE_06215 [Lysobacter sp.]
MRTTEILMVSGLVAALGLAGCNKRQTDDTLTDAAPEPAAVTAPAPTPQPADTAATPQSAAGSLTVATAGASGPYLANAAGSALYALEGNVDGSKCTDACLEAWPPVLATEGMPLPGVNVQPTLMSTIKRTDGPLQVAYNHYPLHRYSADTGAGRTAGHGVKDQWGTWYLVNPQGDPLPFQSGGN